LASAEICVSVLSPGAVAECRRLRSLCFLRKKFQQRPAWGQVADNTRGKFTFRRVNPQGKIFISLRKCQGGGEGLPQVDGIIREQARDMSEYQDLIASPKRASVFNS